MASLRDEHVEGTRRALVAAARRCFGAAGYGATSVDDIAAAAGVTKGALYHHFAGKRDLFVTVYDELEHELNVRAQSATTDVTAPLDVLRRGFAAFLDLALDPVVQRIALLDAPSVLGTAAKMEIDTRHSLAGVRASIRASIDDGQIAPLDPDVVAQLLIAACSQAALLIATAADAPRARRDAGAALDRLITGLAPTETAGIERPRQRRERPLGR